MIRFSQSLKLSLFALFVLVLSSCTPPPVTLVQRAAETRSSEDIAKDNEIVIDVNKLMAKYETISVSTAIYEQRLVVYGLLDDQSIVDGLRKDLGSVEGIKALYWHVEYMSEEEQEAKKDELLGFAGATEAQVEIESSWLETEGVSSLNYRAAIDPLGNAYILGRAFTAEEEALVLVDARKADGIKNVVDYVEVRAKES